MTYTVKTYEFFEWNSDHDKAPNYLLVGSYANSDDAITTCKDVVATQMKKLRMEGKSFDEAVSAFRIYGEVPVIFGDPPVNFDYNGYIATLDERTGKLDKIIYQIIEELTRGEDTTISHSTQIVSSTDKAIKARWKAALLYRIDGQQSLQGLPIPDGVAQEERTILLTWATKKDCTELSDDFNYEWTDENQDTETWIDWDSSDVTDQMFEIAKERILDGGGADFLIEWFGSVEEIKFDLYPKLFQPFLRALVDELPLPIIVEPDPKIAERATDILDTVFDMNHPTIKINEASDAVNIVFRSIFETRKLIFDLKLYNGNWHGEVLIEQTNVGPSHYPMIFTQNITSSSYVMPSQHSIDDLVQKVSRLSLSELFSNYVKK